ncbi:cadmium resistance transporter [Nocardia sp. NPDC088792]|uniref:cadmium resistance transporter n=1 Tax=Nocardia sp. NPDC088792 TaxID=3364332 RepID=UPI00381B72A6
MVAGQYLGFLAILGVSFAGAVVGSTLLPESALPYFGLIPIALGVRAGWKVWRDRHSRSDDDHDPPPTRQGPGIWRVAVVTFANGSDNIGVYAPLLAVASVGAMFVYTTVFLIGVAVWCAAGKYFASHRLVAKALARWGHIVLPVALITIGLAILIGGGVFGAA